MHRPHPVLVALLALTAAFLLAGPALLSCGASSAPAPVIEHDVEQVVLAKGTLARDLCCYQPAAEDAGADAPAER